MSKESEQDKNKISIQTIINPNTEICSSLTTSSKESEILNNLKSKCSNIFPIDTYFENKKKNSIFYQHPSILKLEHINIIDELSNLKRDFINKWFENTSLQTVLFSLKTGSFILECQKRIENINDCNNKLKIKLRKYIDSVSNNIEYKLNFMIIKIALHNFNSLNLENIDDNVKYSKTIFDNFSRYFENHYELFFLFSKDFIKIVHKIEYLLNQTKEDDENLKIKLLSIIYYLSIYFKSCYGFLFLIQKVQKYHLEKKFQIDIPIFQEKEFPNIKLNDVTHNGTNFINIKTPFSLENSSGVYISKKNFFIYNNIEGEILKINKINTLTNDKFNITQIKKIEKKRISLFSFRKYLFTFSHDDFRKSDNLIKAYNSSLIEINKKNIKYDEMTIDLLFKKKKDYYLSFITSSEEEKQNYIEVDNYSSYTSIFSEDNYLYILHPIFQKPNNETFIYYSKKYIYALDIYQISIEKENILFSFSKSIILRDEIKKIKFDDISNKEQIIDKLFESSKSLNKFIIVNGILISSDGIILFDIKNNNFNPKDGGTDLTSINVIQEDRTNTITLSYQNTIFYLILKKDSLSDVYELKEHVYETNCFYSMDLFNSNKILLNSINKNLKKENIIHITEKEDIFDEIFNLNSLDEIKNQKDKDNKIKENDTNIVEYILFSLCEYIFENNYDNFKGDDIGKYIRYPFILSNDYPNYLLLEELLKNNEKNEEFLLVILLLIHIHVNALKKIEMNICQIFGDESKTENFINILMNIAKNNTKLEHICLIIALKILTISNLNVKLLENIIDFITFNHNNIDDDFLINKKEVLKELFNYCQFSKSNTHNILNSKKLYEFNNKLIKVFFTNNNCLLFNDFISSFKHYFKYLYSYIISNNEYYDLFSKITNQVLKLSKDYINNNNLNELNFKIPLIKFCLNTSLIYYKDLPNIFSLINWNDLFELIKQLSNIKEKNDIKPEDKYDIIFDNLSFSNEQSKYLLFSLPNFENSSLYIEEFIVQKEKIKKKNISILGVIEAVNNSKEIYRIDYFIHQKQFSYSNLIINNLNYKDGIKIRFNSEANNFFIKIRLSNYKFFNEIIDPILNPCIELFNNILKKFSFYLGEDDKITNLFNTRLFSLGVPKNKNEENKNNDLKLFEENLQNENIKKILSTKKSEIIFDNEYISTEINTEKKTKIDKYSSLNDLITDKNILKILNRYESQMKIIIKGEIPDKLVKYAFFIILHHENLLEQFIKYCYDENLQKELEVILNKNIFYLLLEYCSDLRITYKKIKDELINQNLEKEIINNFDFIFRKLHFLYTLNPQNKVNSLPIKYNQKIFNQLNQIIKEHVFNISEIIFNKEITIENILEGYEKIQTKAKFREISLLILIEVLNNIKENDVICYIISNYYYNFSEYNSIPSIYNSLKCVNENIVRNITNSFHIFLSLIVEKIEKEKLSKFNLSIYLNFLIWKIRKRNFVLFASSNKKQIFNLFKNKTNLEKANKFLFILPESGLEGKNYINFYELRPIDDYHLGKILTDLFIYYTYRVIQLENKNEKNENLNNEKKLNELNLVRLESINQTDYFSILETIINAFGHQFQNIFQVFNNQTYILAEKEIIFPFDEKSFEPFIKKMIQKKLDNVLNEFNKICLSQFTSYKNLSYSQTIFKYHLIWKTLLSLIKYSNYENSQLIFNILKMFTVVEFDNLNLLIDKNNNENSNNFKIENFYDFILNISKYTTLITNYFKFIYENKEQEKLRNYIFNKIKNEKKIFLLSFFNYNIQNITHFSPVIYNSKLNLENKLINFIPEEKDLELLIKRGYYLKQEKLRIIGLISNKIKEDEDNSIEEDESITNSYNSHEDEDDDEHVDTIKNIAETFTLINISREIPILSDEIINGMIPNFTFCNENEIIYDDNYFDSQDFPYDIIKYLIDYLSDNLLYEKRFSPLLLIEYIQILKCLIFNYSKNDVVKQFIVEKSKEINQLLSINLSTFPHSIIFKDKIEVCLSNCIYNLDKETLEKEQKLNFNDITIGVEDNEDKMKKNQISYGNLIEDSSDSVGGIIYLYNIPSKKYTIPIVDKVKLKNCSWYDKSDTKDMILNVLNLYTFEKLIEKYKDVILLDDENETYTPFIRREMVILCSDLLKELGLDEKRNFKNEDEIKNKKKKKIFVDEVDFEEYKKLEEDNKNEENDEEEVIELNSQNENEFEEISEENIEIEDDKKNNEDEYESLYEKIQDEKNEEEDEKIDDDDERNLNESIKIYNEDEDEIQLNNNIDYSDEGLNIENEEENKSFEKNNEKKNKEKEKDKNKSNHKKKDEKNEKWEKFYKIIAREYELSTCVFLVEDKYFNKFPLRMACFSFDSNYFTTDNLTILSLPITINDLTDYISPLSEEVTSNLLNPKKNNENKEKDKDKEEKNHNKNLFLSLCQRFKIKTKKGKLKYNDRYLDDMRKFYNLYDTSPNFKNSNNMMSYQDIKLTGIFIIKFYLRLLLIKDNNFDLIDLKTLKLLYAITSYYKLFFNKKQEYDIIVKGIEKYFEIYIQKIDINELIKFQNIITYDIKIIDENDFLRQTQDKFMIMIINSLVKIKENQKLKSLFSILLNKTKELHDDNNLENCIILFPIIILLLSKVQENEIKNYYLEYEKSPLIISFTKIINNDSRLQKTDFSIYCLEFLLNSLIIFKKNNILISSFDPIVVKLTEDYDILLNKLNSKYLLDILIQKDKSLVKENTKTLFIPENQESPYILKIQKKNTKKLYISENNNQNNNQQLICVSEPNNEIYEKITNKKTIEIPLNTCYIYNDKESSKRSIIIDGFNKFKDKIYNNILLVNESMEFEIINTHHFTRDCMIGVDKQGNYYIFGKLGSINSHKSFKPFPELNEINSLEKVVYIGNNVILTTVSLYFSPSKVPENLEMTRAANGYLKKYSLLNTNETFIKASYEQSIVLLTDKGEVYGILLEGDYRYFSENQINETKSLFKLSLPSHLKVIDIGENYSCVIFLCYDKNYDKNVVYINCDIKNYHFFSRNTTEEFVFNKEVGFFSGKSIIKILNNDDIFCALGKDGKVYYLDRDEYNKYGINTIDFFINLQIKIIDIYFSGKGIVFKGIDEKDGNEMTFIAGDLYVSDFSINKRNAKIKISNPEMIDFDYYMKNKNKDKEKNKNENKIFLYKKMISVLGCGSDMFILFNFYQPLIQINNDKFNNLNISYKLVTNDKEYLFTPSLCKKNNDSIYLFIITEDLKNEKLEEGYDFKFVINGKKTKNTDFFISKLSLFIKDIEDIKEIYIQIPSSNQNEFSNENLKKEFLYKYSDIESYVQYNKIDIRIEPILENASNETKLKYENIKKEIEKNLSEINIDFLTQYIRSKEFYDMNYFSMKKTLNEYLIDKYHNYDKYQKISEEKTLDLISEISNQIVLSSENLLKHSSIVCQTSLMDTLFSNTEFIEKKIREKYFNQNLSLLKTSQTKLKIKVSRSLAMKNKELNLKDTNYEWTIFSQIIKRLKNEKNNYFFKNKNSNLFSIILIGENATDAGGPAREIITQAFEELTSPYLDLFIPTSNNISQSGNDRDKYTINPSAKSEKQIEIFKCLGKILAYVISSENYAPLPLSQFVFKQILNYKIEPIDIENIDIHSYNSIIKVLTYGSIEQKKKLYGQIQFTYQLSNGEIIELIPNGKNILLNESNQKKYLELYLKARSNEIYEQSQAIKIGLCSVIPEQIIKFLTWQDFEYKICGPQTFDMDLLIRNTKYTGFKPTDDTIKFFWKFLNECTLEEKYLYLKFANGFSRLPSDDSGFNKNPHQITKMEDINPYDYDKMLPRSHTCFFTIDIPPYSSYEILKEKMLYAMKNSMVISDTEEFLGLDI